MKASNWSKGLLLFLEVNPSVDLSFNGVNFWKRCTQGIGLKTLICYFFSYAIIHVLCVFVTSIYFDSIAASLKVKLEISTTCFNVRVVLTADFIFNNKLTTHVHSCDSVSTKSLNELMKALFTESVADDIFDTRDCIVRETWKSISAE